MRGGGAAWRWAWGLGFALLCVYIAFDLLDLDGSQLRWRSEAAIAAESCSAEVDRGVKAPSPSAADRIVPALVIHQRDPGFHLVAAAPSLLRSDRLLPRRHLPRLNSRVGPRSADPA